MAYSAYDILQPQIITGVISTISPPATSLQKLFGWETFSLAAQDASIFDPAILTVPESDSMSGNYEDIPTRTASYDIFDYSRRVAGGSRPMTPNTTITPKAVGNVPYTLPRVAETINLPLERIYQNQRPIGGPTSQLDSRGERFIKGQIAYQYERVANLVEFQTASLLRGKYYYFQDGDALKHSWTSTSATTTVDYQLTSAGSDIDAFGTSGGTWQTDTSDIPADIRFMSAYLEENVGMPLGVMVMNSKTLGYLLNNTAVQKQAGTANQPFNNYALELASGKREFAFTLRGIPWVRIVVVDYGLEVWDGSDSYDFTKLIPDDYVAFMPQPDPRWVTYYRGCEPITLRPYGGTESVIQPYGMFMYPYVKPNPASIDLNCNHNGMPVCFRPKGIVFAKVVYT